MRIILEGKVTCRLHVECNKNSFDGRCHLLVSEVGLTRKSLFEILARSETRFLDPKFSRDFRETCESKLVARLASRESHRQKFRSENREK